IFLHDTLQARSGTCQVIEFHLAGRDDQKGIRGARVGWSGTDHGLQTGDGPLEVLDRVKTAAAVEAGFVYEGTLRIGLDELGERFGGFLVLTGPEALHGLIVGGLLGGVGNLEGGFAGGRAGLLIAFGQITQPLHLAPQPRHFLLQVFDLISLAHAYLTALVDERLQLLAQIENGAPGLIIGKRMGRPAEKTCGQHGGQDRASKKGGSQAHVVVSVQMKTPRRMPATALQQTGMPILLLINDVSAAVLCVIGFSVAQGARTLLAEADGFDLTGIDAQQAHHARNGFRTTLAQRQVVFGTPACVGVALNANTLLRIAAQVVRMHFHDAAVLIGNGVAVKLEVHRALLRQRALRVEWVHNLARAGAIRSGATRAGPLIKRHRAASRQCGGQSGESKASCNARAHLISFQKRESHVNHSVNGPQTGSRTLPLSADKVCRTRPSTEVTASTLRPSWTELNRICIPLGAKLGD